MSDEVHAKLKIKVFEDNTSIQEVLQNYIIKYIDEEKDIDMKRDDIVDINTKKLFSKYLSYVPYLEEMEKISQELIKRFEQENSDNKEKE